MADPVQVGRNRKLVWRLESAMRIFRSADSALLEIQTNQLHYISVTVPILYQQKGIKQLGQMSHSWRKFKVGGLVTLIIQNLERCTLRNTMNWPCKLKCHIMPGIMKCIDRHTQDLHTAMFLVCFLGTKVNYSSSLLVERSLYPFLFNWVSGVPQSSSVAAADTNSSQQETCSRRVSEHTSPQ